MLVYVPFFAFNVFLPVLYYSAGRIGSTAFQYAVLGVYIAFDFSLGAVAYRALRHAKDGPDTAAVAAVFA